MEMADIKLVVICGLLVLAWGLSIATSTKKSIEKSKDPLVTRFISITSLLLALTITATVWVDVYNDIKYTKNLTLCKQIVKRFPDRNALVVLNDTCFAYDATATINELKGSKND